MDVEHYRGLLRTALDGRPVVLTGGALHTDLVTAARDLGAPSVFVLDGDAERLGADGSALFTDDWREQLDRFDPNRMALVLGHNFHALDSFTGRRYVGARPRAWASYEDKTEVVGLWERADLATAPAMVVDPSPDSLRQASALLDEGWGTVWAGDHRDGEHHSGRHLRWVRDSTEAASAAEYFATSCDRVRVMPFLAGRPCSIHALVADDGAAVLRPVAMVIDIDEAAGTFTYQTCDLSWRAHNELRDEMRTAARAIASVLAADVGYRGAFTLDGIATSAGFRPTEINARWGAGLTELATRMPALALRFIHAFMAEGEPLPWRTKNLERLILTLDSGNGTPQGH